MANPRSIVSFLLLAALVPVTMFGVANWRATAEPEEPAPASRVAPLRPQLGRAAAPWSLAVESSRPTGRDPYLAPGTVPRADWQPPRTYTAGLGAEPDTAHPAMVVGTGHAPADPIRRLETVGGGGRRPNPASSSPAVSTGWEPLATVEFIAVMQDMTLQQREDFLAPAVRELKIVVWWNVAGTQTQRLEIFSPDGALYRRLSVGFDGTAAAPGKTSVETRLPVGGTWITEYSLFGAWRVDVYLGNQPTPITSAYFALNA